MSKVIAFILLLFFQPKPATFTSIEKIPGSDSLKMFVRMENDLFLRDYQQSIFDDLDLDTLRRLESFPADLANNYINSKISIYVNKNLIIGKLLKMERANGDIRFEMLYRVADKIKRITVRNEILNGLYSSVDNLTIIRIKNLETEITFTPEQNEKTIILK